MKKPSRRTRRALLIVVAAHHVGRDTDLALCPTGSGGRNGIAVRSRAANGGTCTDAERQRRVHGHAQQSGGFVIRMRSSRVLGR